MSRTAFAVPVRAAAVAIGILLWAPGIDAQEAGEPQSAAAPAPPKAWSNEAQIAFVSTSGNSSNTTFSISERFTYNWTYAEMVVRAELFRSSSSVRQLFNEPTGVREELLDQTTAERYELSATYRQNLVSELYWYGMGSWLRNEPAGLRSRTGAGGGVGYRFIEDAMTLVVGEAGIGLTRENRTAGFSDTFVDARGFLEVRRKLSDTADFQAAVEIFENLQNTADLRLDLRTAVTARINSTFALRLGWALDYDKDPVVVLVETVPGVIAQPFAFDKTDQTLSASVVVSF